MPTVADLPLRWLTPPGWAPAVLATPLALLDDHAHLERKAASNALALLQRWPERLPPERWTQTLAAIAKDEADHLALVLKLLHKRGGSLSKTHRNRYAAGLRAMIRPGGGLPELIDRLLISALIEARSAERFAALGEATDDRELRKLYRGLWASEHGHYAAFIELAQLAAPGHDVESRWQTLVDDEAALLAGLPPGKGMHSGPPA